MHHQIRKGIWRDIGIQTNTDQILINTTRWADTFNYILPALFVLEGRKTSNNILSEGRGWEEERTNQTKLRTERELYTSSIFTIYIPTLLPTLQFQVLLQSDHRYNLGQWWQWNKLRTSVRPVSVPNLPKDEAWEYFSLHWT